MRNLLKPLFGQWTATLHCICGEISVIDFHAYRCLRAFDLDFCTPKCICGQELLSKKCVIPDELWHFEAYCKL